MSLLHMMLVKQSIEVRNCTLASLSVLACGSMYCHTRLHLGFLAKLRILQVPACKMEPQGGIIIVRNRLSGRQADRPTNV